MVRFQIRLNEDEFRLVRKLADQEYRDLRQQVGVLVREALENRGLLRDEPNNEHGEQNTNAGDK